MLSVAFVQNTCSLLSVLLTILTTDIYLLLCCCSSLCTITDYSMAALWNMMSTWSAISWSFNCCSQLIVSYGLSCCVIWAVILLLRAGIIRRLKGFNTRKHWAIFSKENMCHFIWKIINPLKMLKEVQSWRNLFIPGRHKFCFIIIICLLKAFLVHCCLLLCDLILYTTAIM
jgi:hypothetical protein